MADADKARIDKMIDAALDAMNACPGSGDDVASAVFTLALRFVHFGMRSPQANKEVLRHAVEQLWRAAQDPQQKVM